MMDSCSPYFAADFGRWLASHPLVVRAAAWTTSIQPHIVKGSTRLFHFSIDPSATRLDDVYTTIEA